MGWNQYSRLARSGVPGDSTRVGRLTADDSAWPRSNDRLSDPGVTRLRNGFTGFLSMRLGLIP